MRNRFRLAPAMVFAGAGILIPLLPCSAQAAEPTTQIDLPAQPLSQAIQSVARQAGINILVDPRLVAGREAPALRTDLSISQTLGLLLKGTGLTARFVDEKTITLVAGSAASTTAARPEAGAAEAEPLLLAQSGSATDANSASPPNEAPDANGIAEIVVTATKRAEKVQDVPLSISVLGADEIERRGLVSGEDYLRSVPGVNQVDSGQGYAIVMRGIETTPESQNFSSGTTVATYFGETPTTNSAGLGGGSGVDPKLVDIERIEVLRGPQGTSFGSSSLGGAVRVIPAAPQLDRFSGKLAAHYSSTAGTGGANNMLQGVLNIPLVADKLAIRAVGYRYLQSGFYRNVAGSDAAFQATAATFGAEDLAVDKGNMGEATFTGGRLAAPWQATDALKFTLTHLHQDTKVDGIASANTGKYEQTLYQLPREIANRGEPAGVSDTDIDLTNLVMESDLGWATLLASVSHVSSGSLWSFPSLFSLGEPASTAASSGHREYSGEIRLVSQFEGPVKLLGGLYVEDLQDDFRQPVYWFGSAESNPFSNQAFLGQAQNNRELKQRAAFGEVAWEFLPGLTFTGGARIYDYDRTIRVYRYGDLFGGEFRSSLASSASDTSYKANLSYKPNDQVMVYGGWAQGFRLGRPQNSLPAGVCDLNGDGILDGTSETTLESTGILRSDNVDSLELGTKLALLDRRLTVSADVYRIDWTGLPVGVYAPSPPSGCGLQYNANAGQAISKGLELQINYRVTSALQIDLGGSTTDVALSKDAPALNAAKGDRLPGSPKFNANLAVQYGFIIAGHATYVRADSFYIGGFYGDLAQSPETRAGNYVKVNASVRTMFDALSVELFVQNLTNADDFTYRGISSGGGAYTGFRLRPRTIGVQLGYSF